MSPHRSYQMGVRTGVACLAGTGVVLGVAMIVGGPGRFGANGFAVARTVPGHVYTWGGVLTVAGALGILGITLHWARQLVMVGLALEGCWFAFFAVSLGLAMLADPKVAVTGPIAYTSLACLCAIGYDTGRSLRR